MKRTVICIILASVLLAVPVLGANYLLKQVIEEGETQHLTIGNAEYTITLVTVSDSTRKAIFEVNGERSKTLTDDESHKFSDGTVMLAREILPNEGGEGKDMVQFNLYAGLQPKAAVQELPEPEQTVEQTFAEVSEQSPIAQPTAEPVPTAQPAQETKPNQKTPEKARVDMTKVKVEKKGWWGRFVDWWKNLF